MIQLTTTNLDSLKIGDLILCPDSWAATIVKLKRDSNEDLAVTFKKIFEKNESPPTLQYIFCLSPMRAYISFWRYEYYKITEEELTEWLLTQ